MTQQTFLLISLFLDKNVGLTQCVPFSKSKLSFDSVCKTFFFCWWLSHYQGRDYARFWLKLAQVISKPTPNLMGYQQEYNVICDNRFKAGSNFFDDKSPPKKLCVGGCLQKFFFGGKLGAWSSQNKSESCSIGVTNVDVLSFLVCF